MRPKASLSTLMLCTCVVLPAFAEPTLQVYLEDSAYDLTTETWFGEAALNTGCRIWVIADTSPDDNPVGVLDVKLSVAYDMQFDQAGMLEITLTPTVAGADYAAFEANRVAIDPTWSQLGAENTSPRLYNEKRLDFLPSHNEFGRDYVWQEFQLGDFLEADSWITDFGGQESIPTPKANRGQINVYNVNVSATEGIDLHGLSLHFDAYGHAAGSTRDVFSPFSHDAVATHTPAPSTIVALLGMGAMALIALIRRRVGD